jgi:hypothetical protein
MGSKPEVVFPNSPKLSDELEQESAELHAKTNELENRILALQEEVRPIHDRYYEIDALRHDAYIKELKRYDMEQREPWRRIQVYRGNFNENNIKNSIGEPFEIFEGINSYGGGEPVIQTHTLGTRNQNFWELKTGHQAYQSLYHRSLHPADLKLALRESGLMPEAEVMPLKPVYWSVGLEIG